MVYTLTGKNTYGVREALQKIVDGFKNQHGQNIEIFHCGELENTDAVLDAVRTILLFDPKKLVIVHDVSQNKQLFEKLETIIESAADSTDLVIVDQKLDKRSKMYKYLTKTTDFQEFSEPNEPQLTAWAEKRAAALGAKISSGAARYLMQKVGRNQQRLDQELQKLALYNEVIDQAAIDDLVEATPQSKIFDMLDALFQTNSTRAWELYQEQRALGEEPQKIIAMLTWQLQQLVIAVYAPTKTVQALTKAGMSPYSAQKALHMAKGLTKPELKHMVTELARLDKLSKTEADAESTLEVYLSEVAA